MIYLPWNINSSILKIGINAIINLYPKFKEIFEKEMGDVTERELYEAVNIVTPSLIRTEADEVTYGFHIVIR